MKYTCFFLFLLSSNVIFTNETIKENQAQTQKKTNDTSIKTQNKSDEVLIVEPQDADLLNEQNAIHNQKSILKNDALIKKYQFSQNTEKYNFAEHLVLSLFFGLVSGAAFGGLAGLYNFDLNNVQGSLSSFYLVGGVFAFVGLASGLTVALIEKYVGFNQFYIGWQLFKFTWYSTLISGFFGTIIGAIVFGVNNNLNAVLNYTAYGAIAGTIIGFILFGVLGKFKKPKDITFDIGVSSEGANFVVSRAF